MVADKQTTSGNSTVAPDSPSSAADLQFAEIGPEDPRHQQAWDHKPSLGSGFIHSTINLDGAVHEMWSAVATDSRPAIVYTDKKTLQLLAFVAFKAQGEPEDVALERSLQTKAFVYHGGETSLDKQGFPRNAIILDINPPGSTRAEALTWGATIRHELSHAQDGKGELPAHQAEQAYLARNGVVIRPLTTAEIENHIRDKGQEPTVTVSSEDVISPSISPVGGPRGVGPVYHVSSPQLDRAQLERNRLETERRAAELRAEQQLAAERARAEAAALEASQRAAQAAREQWINSSMPPLAAYMLIPVTRFFFGPPETDSQRESKVEGVTGGGISGGLGGGGQQQRSRQQSQQQGQKQDENNRNGPVNLSG